MAETSNEVMRHGSLIVLGGSVQSMGINKRTNDPYVHKNIDWLSEHAEMAAIRRAARTQGATLYIARVNKHGEERMSKPCTKCMALAYSVGIKKCVYTIDNSFYL